MLRVEQAGVEGQFGQCSGDGSEREGHVALHFASSHLCVDHVVVHGVEAQQVGCQLSVERKAGAIASCRSERVAVGHTPCGLEEEHVVAQTLGVRTEPESEAGRHGHLQVCVSGHEHVLVLFALGEQFVEEQQHAVGHLAQFVAREELQVHQHLIVARASRVYLLAHVAQSACEHQLHLRVNVLYAVFDDERSLRALRVDVAQFGEQERQLLSVYESDAFEHGDVGHATEHVVGCQEEVHLAVSSHGEALNLRIHLEILFPKLVCHNDTEAFLRFYS